MKLKAFRKELGKTQQEMADFLNMSKVGYSSYELGKRQPNFEILIKLADYFHTTVDALLGHEVPYLLDKSILSEKQRNLLNLVVSLNDRQCEKAEAYINGLVEGGADRLSNIQKFYRE